MKRILSFGGGLQTTALAIMVAKGELEVDEVVFADTGAEKPETYWYMENYIKPMLDLTTIRNEQPHYQPDLYSYYIRIQDIPDPMSKQRKCTSNYKIRPMNKYCGIEIEMLIGFSLDERKRTFSIRHKFPHYPLIERRMTAADCHHYILNYGFPIPLKSSCFFCPYQHITQWNWLKNNHQDLFQKALDLEENFYQRKPHMKDTFGLLGGTPLWRLKDGLQPEMFQLEERSCWSGHCGH